MNGAALVHAAALALALAALLDAGRRVLTALTPERSVQWLGAAVLAAAVAVVSALVLGLVGLGGSPPALLLGAGVVWAVARGLGIAPVPTGPTGSVLPAPAVWARAAAGVAGGALIGVAALMLHRPVLGQDAVTYHLPEVVAFVASGHPGRVLDVFYGLPVGNYPLTQEVLLAWVTGLDHGFAGALLTTLASVPLLGLAGWIGLRELGVPAPVRTLALATLVTVPLVVQAWVQPGTDLPATAWLAAVAALCLAARRRPALLGPAIVAAGLAGGTKTTALSWALVILAVTLWCRRRDLRGRWPGLLAGLALAMGAGGVWYLRNWITHGSPLWPFARFPAGDPLPPILRALSGSLLGHLHGTLLVHLHSYATALAGGVVLVLGGILILVPAGLARRRRPVLAAAAVLIGTLVYAAGPLTGLPPHSGVLFAGIVGSTLRYLMPVFAAAVTGLALLGADRARRLRAAGGVLLAGALVWNLVSDVRAGFGLLGAGWLIPAVLIGGLLGALTVWPRGGVRVWVGPVAPPVLGAVALLALVLALAIGSTHFAFRYARSGDYGSGVQAVLDAQPAYRAGRLGVLSAPTGFAGAAGDGLEHPLSVPAPTVSCRRLFALWRTRYLIVAVEPDTAAARRFARLEPRGTVGGCVARTALPPLAVVDGEAVYAPLPRAGWWSYPPLGAPVGVPGR